MANTYSFEQFRNAFDFNQLFSTQRRNFEALSAAYQVMVEGAQAAARRQAEVLRDNTEQGLKASREIFASSTPEANIARQGEFARSLMENTLSSMREMSEMLSKSSFEAYDVLNKRVGESLSEIGQSAASAPRRKSA